MVPGYFDSTSYQVKTQKVFQRLYCRTCGPSGRVMIGVSNWLSQYFRCSGVRRFLQPKPSAAQPDYGRRVANMRMASNHRGVIAIGDVPPMPGIGMVAAGNRRPGQAYRSVGWSYLWRVCRLCSLRLRSPGPVQGPVGARLRR